MSNNVRSKIIIVIKSILIVLAITMNMSCVPYENISNSNEVIRALFILKDSINSFGMQYSVLVLLLLVPIETSFYSRKIENKKDISIVATILALFTLVGKSFHETDSFLMIINDIGQIIKSCIFVIGYYNLFYMALEHIQYYIFERCIWKYREFKYTKLKGFILLIICWMPYLIAFFPGMTPGDTPEQIAQYYGMPNTTSSYLRLISENVLLNNHHPVSHTLLMGGLFSIGHSNGFDNLGIFIYTVFQYIVIAYAISNVVFFLYKIKAPKVYIYIILGLYCIVPIFPTYAILTTKDIIYSAGFLFFTMYLLNVISNEKKLILKKRELLGYILACLVCVFFRHNGIYVLAITLLIMLIFYKEHRKFALYSLVGVVFALVLVNRVILPAFSITGGSKREALSIPFQQTARYIVNYEDEITDEEMSVIKKILDVDYCKEEYNPRLSDPVKGTYNEYATKEELRAYFKVWFEMLLKHPVCYIEAFLNNYYGYFYYGDKAVWQYDKDECENCQKLLRAAGFNVYFIDRFHSLRTFIELYISIFNRFPLSSLFHSCALYSWIMLVVSIIIFKNGKKFFVALVPAIITILICFASPLDGTLDLRYMYPVMLVLPIYIYMAIKMRKKDEDTERKCC